MQSPGDSTGSFFCFHGLGRIRRTEEILGLVVPHLHQALCLIASLQEIRPGLAPRELEVPKWVKQGKSSESSGARPGGGLAFREVADSR